jgi:membrane protein
MFWVVGLIYYFGPNVKHKFRIITPGAIFTVGVWLLLGATFRLYVDRFGKYGETYGAVGGVIILLFFFYIDALVLLVGAEINSEIDAAKRAMAHKLEKPPPPAETLDTEPATNTP